MPSGAIPFPFGICRICKDRATGVHYGVTTCEGCKGFFKRSITRGDKYKCFFGGDCDVTPKNRNRCKSCRFKKCLDVGMSVEAVRMGRIPKIEKEKALEVFHQGGSDFNNLEIEVEMTGNGIYDFKINPKEGHENNGTMIGLQTAESGRLIQMEKSWNQTNLTGLQTAEQGRLIQKEPSWNQTNVSMSFKTGSQKQQNEGAQCDSSQDCVSRQIANFTRLQSEQCFPVSSTAEFNSYHSHQMPLSAVRFSSGQRSCNWSATISSPDYSNSCENEFDRLKAKDISGPDPNNSGFEKQASEHFKVPLTHFNVATDESMTGRNVQRQHSNEIALHSHAYHEDFDINTPPSYIATHFSPFSENSGGHLNQPDVQECKFPSQQVLGSTQRQFDGHSNVSTKIHGNDQSTFDVESKQVSEERVAFGQGYHQLSSAIHTRKAPGQCFAFQTCSYPASRDNSFDEEMRLSHLSKESSFHDSDKKSEDYPLNLVQQLPTENNLIGNDSADVNKTVNDNEASVSNAFPADQFDNKSSENFKCSSPGSVISREGSNSSQRSGYSPAIIQILLDQVLESNQGSAFAENMKKQFDHPKADHNVLQRILNLVNDASEKRKHVGDREIGDSSYGLSKLPENKLEGMNRFLNDLHNRFSEREAPLLKKKRCIEETELKESFENLDVQIPVNSDMFPSIQPNDSTQVQVQPVQVSPGQVLPIQISPQELSKTQRIPFHSNHVPTWKYENCAHNQNFKTMSHTVDRDPSMDIQPQQVTSNHNYQSHPHDTVTNQNRSNNFQNVSANQNAQSVPIPSTSAMSDINILKQSAVNTVEVMDNLVTSTGHAERKEKSVDANAQEMLKTIDCMNLAMKILNRFKPEHREKIRLYKQGQLHLKILTDSDEDCALIYQKLMEGIPGLNDRIIGFCDSVPGFADVSKEDKEKLIKRSYYDMWTLSYSEYFQNGKSYWILPSGEIYSAAAMRKILNDEMVDTIMAFSNAYNRLEFSDLETALFSAVRLTTISGVELEGRTKVEQLHSHLLDTLAFEIKRNHKENHMRLLIELFQLVPLIEAINRIQSQIIANFSVNRFNKKPTRTADVDQKSEDTVKQVQVSEQSL